MHASCECLLDQRSIFCGLTFFSLLSESKTKHAAKSGPRYHAAADAAADATAAADAATDAAAIPASAT